MRSGSLSGITRMATLLSEAVLKDRAGVEVKASTLWAAQPALVVALRRPGCLLCREEAIKLWQEHVKFEELGVRMALVLHEWRELEVEAFAPAYWGGEVYFDESKAFYATVHGGSVKRSSLLPFLNPFSGAWKNARRAKASGVVKESNFTGDGLTLGGVLVFKKGAIGDAPSYVYAEKTFGDHAPLEEVLAACKSAATAAQQ